MYIYICREPENDLVFLGQINEDETIVHVYIQNHLQLNGDEKLIAMKNMMIY